MEIKTVKINQIKPYHLNCKIHNEENINAIKKSLEKFQQYSPLIISSDSNEIIIGNGTYQALKQLNYKEVQVVFLKLTEQQQKILNISDNKTSELSFWNENLIEKLSQFDQDFLNILNFDQKFLKKFEKITVEQNKKFDISENDVILNDDQKLLVSKQNFIKCPCCGREFLKQ